MPPHLLQLWFLGFWALNSCWEEAHIFPQCFSYCSKHLGLWLEHHLLVLAPCRADTIQKGLSVGLNPFSLRLGWGEGGSRALSITRGHHQALYCGEGGTAVPCAPLPRGGSLQPPYHCDTRVQICKHGGDQGVACS